MAAAVLVERAYEAAARSALAALERNLLPDAVTRRLTRLLLAQRLRLGYLPSAPLQLQDLVLFAHCKHRPSQMQHLSGQLPCRAILG
jgi:hypothetical protein